MALLVSLGALIGTDVYKDYHREKINNLPDWANVKMTAVGSSPGTWSSYVSSFDGIPGTVFINGEKWELQAVDKVEPIDPSRFTYAETVCEKRVIFYARFTSPKMEMHDSIMHELFHAGACVHGGATWWNSKSDEGDEHDGIYHLGHFTAQLFHDNPELAVWLSK